MTISRPQRKVTNARSSSGPIAKLLGLRGTSVETTRVDYISDAVPGWEWSLIDSGAEGRAWVSGGASALQVLYRGDESRTTITIDGKRFAIAPGENVSLGARSRVELTDGMLVLLIATDRGGAQPVHPPTHGRDVFDGFNRRTICIAGPDLVLERWKLTGPQRIAVDDGRPRVIVGLSGSVSLILDREIVAIAPGESVVVTVGTSGMVIVPDGLGYVAIAYPAVP